jgi:glycosyltransferase involved in cell wall biosynthesis
MKIAVMLRHFEQKDGGVKVYTRKVLPLVFSLAPQHNFVLLYQNPELIGTYRDYANVEEVCVGLVGSVLWDQIGVPWAARRHHVDLIFNPKFTVPLLGKAMKVFVLHGSEWFAINDQFLWYDRLYLKYAVPIYFRYANAIIAVSHAVKRDAVKFMGVSEAKVAAIQNGFDPSVFRAIADRDRLQRVAATYALPDQFILWVGQIESRKNIGRLLQAFARIRDRIPHQLVLAGEQRFSFPMAAGAARDLKLIEDLGLKNRVHFTGWIPHEDLAAVYVLADLFALPSLYEGFGIPLLEAMACECPIVTANTCAPPEVAGEAAYLVDPLNVDAIAEGMLEMLTNDPLRETKVAYGLQRVKNFNWEKCAREILTLFETLAHSASRWQATPIGAGAVAVNPSIRAGRVERRFPCRS